MRCFRVNLIGVTALLIFSLSFPAQAANGNVSVEMGPGNAEVTSLEGRAEVIKKGVKAPKHLSLRDHVVPGDQISTGKKSRLELKMPDQSYIRFDEQTRFELVPAPADGGSEKVQVNVKMGLGKIWANVSKIFASKSDFKITTKTAVAGIRGTVYRLNVASDQSVVVKVYWGEVLVNSLRQDPSAAAPGPMQQPSRVLGPSPIQGPRPVTMEQWTYLVGALQQITVSPDGTATAPFRFSIDEDLNDWVRWNRQRDEATPR
ncbi:MAG: FecR family protein [Desulfobacterales bacterium]|nr:FecR family protein [Desulfobacterales bacterium]